MNLSSLFSVFIFHARLCLFGIPAGYGRVRFSILPLLIVSGKRRLLYNAVKAATKPKMMPGVLAMASGRSRFSLNRP